eukprot:GILI01009228.1.p1 GENE.GILI01009228.1~~GILI01009228.1.p1  ORF type:complete len:589 (-),score=157.37 GILI01009228.1:61-1620(-)
MDDLSSDGGSDSEGGDGDGGEEGTTHSSALIGPSLGAKDYYCDVCQKGFGADCGKYQKHCETTHLSCPIAGCGFFCKKGLLQYESESEQEEEGPGGVPTKVKVKRPHYKGEWKIQLHLDTLHYRANGLTEEDFATAGGAEAGAKQGAASSKYVANRLKNFPTADRIQSRVEELFYRASKGEVLTDERRRWLRHHGVVVKRPPAIAAAIMKATTDNSAEGAEEGSKHGSKSGGKDLSHLSPQQLQRLEYIKRKGAAIAHGQCVTSDTPIIVKGQSQLAFQMGDQPAPSTAPRKQIMISRRSEDDDSAATQEPAHAPPPSFYVCTRCGVKGTHWLGECPTKGDTKYDKHTPLPPRVEKERKAQPPTVPNAEEDNDAPPVERSAREEPVAESDQQEDTVTPLQPQATQQVSSPQTDEAMALHKQTQQLLKDGKRGREVEPDGNAVPPQPQQQAVRPARAHANRTDVYIPTLYDRLVAPEKIHGYGLLLQAFRYFTSEDFFGDEEYQPSQKKGARREVPATKN